MAFQAELVRRCAQLRVIACAMNIVARKARDPSAVHETLDKIVPLHAIFVRRSVRKMSECGLPQRVLFELPKIAET